MSDEIDLFRGDLPAILHRHRDATVAALREQKMPPRRAQLAVRARLLLRATVMLEGWGVSLARWMLEAASTGGAQHGAADRLLETCQSALDPSLPALLDRTRATGLALRSDAALALGQCAASHGLWAELAAEGGASATGEFNRFFWRPLHFAAAAGAGDVVQELLRLGADPSQANGAGLTPLHVAIAHQSLPAVRVPLLRRTHPRHRAATRAEPCAPSLFLPPQQELLELASALLAATRLQERRTQGSRKWPRSK